MPRARFGSATCVWSFSCYYVEQMRSSPQVIAFETPGMSLNRARTFGSAFRAGHWQAIWIYLIAPTVGMLANGEVFLRARGVPTVQSCITITSTIIFSEG